MIKRIFLHTERFMGDKLNLSDYINANWILWAKSSNNNTTMASFIIYPQHYSCGENQINAELVSKK